MPSTSFVVWNVRAPQRFLRLGQIVGVVLLVGAALRAGSIVSYAFDGVRMRDWEEVPAVLREFAIVPEPKFDDELPPLRVRYHYRFREADYEGKRADIAQGWYVVGRFLKDQAAELEEHHHDATPVTCYVNPARPEESVLNRRFYSTVFAFRVALFSVLLLGGVAFFGLSSVGLKRRRFCEQQQQRHPDEPWRWQADWAAGRIRSASRIDTWVLLGLAGAYLFVVLPLGLAVLRELGRDLWSVPGAILLLLAWGAFNVARQRLMQKGRLDAGEFQLAGPTGVIGGPLSGVAVIPMKFPEDALLRVSLECRRIEKRGKHAGVTDTVLWRDSTRLQATLAAAHPSTTAVPVYFAIPFNCEPTGPLGAATIHWKLKVGRDGDEGLQKYALFEVPVFRTPESSRHFKADRAVLQKYEAPLETPEVLRNAGCRVELLPNGGELLEFSLFRPLIFFGGLGILIACGAAIAAILHYFHFGFAVMPGLFALVVLFGMWEMLFWKSRVEIRPEAITVTAGLLGLRQRRSLARDENRRLEAGTEFAMQEQTWYCVRLVTQDGQQILLAKRLPSQREADLLAAWLRERLAAVRQPEG